VGALEAGGGVAAADVGGVGGLGVGIQAGQRGRKRLCAGGLQSVTVS